MLLLSLLETDKLRDPDVLGAKSEGMMCPALIEFICEALENTGGKRSLSWPVSFLDVGVCSSATRRLLIPQAPRPWRSWAKEYKLPYNMHALGYRVARRVSM